VKEEDVEYLVVERRIIQNLKNVRYEKWTGRV
jgi:hypothetical protein